MTLQRKIPLAIAVAMLVALLAGTLGLLLTYRALGTFQGDVREQTAQEREVLTMQAHFKTQVQEWKNVLLRGSDAALLERHWQAFLQHEAGVNEIGQRLQPRLNDEAQQATLAQFMTEFKRMSAAYRVGREKFEATGFEASVGDMAVRGIDRQPAELLDKLAGQIAAHRAAVADAAYVQGRLALRWSVSLMLAAAVAGVLLGWRISRAVVRPLVHAIEVASAVADGQLNRSIETTARDETGQLLRALAHMQGQLVLLVGQVRERADVVALASQEIATGNADLSVRTEHQAAALQEAASSMEQLGVTVRRNADTAARATDLAGQARQVAVQGGQHMGDVVRTMRAIEESSRQIVDIVAVIDGIAFQTNILALNAAVEAARAGEQGRGFAVVAGEVRSLAQRAGEAARQVRHLITTSSETVAQGAGLVDVAGTTMSEAVDAIAAVSELIREIAAASGEQSAATQMVSTSVSRMDQATQQNAALVEQTSAAAESLRVQARELVRSVEPFRLA